MEPKLFDIHSHINFPEFDADREAVLARMKEAGVQTITVGVDLESSRSAVSLAEKESNVFAAIGLHPHDNLNELDKTFDHDAYKALALHPRVVAIGECGLDYSRLKDLLLEKAEHLVSVQKEVFRAQIKLACEVNKPLMLHIRPSPNSQDAYEDAYEILKDSSKPKAGNSIQNVKGNVHFFAGNWQTTQKFLALGFTLSFTGVITFARNYDEVIKNAPLEAILSETDCPFVAPIPYRGKRNEPAYVSHIVDKIAEIRGEDHEIVAKMLVQNAKRVFKL